MRRALAPWLFPVVVLIGLLIAATKSTIVYVAAAAVLAWVVVPLALWTIRRHGMWPRAFGGSDGDADRPRNFPGL